MDASHHRLRGTDCPWQPVARAELKSSAPTRQGEFAHLSVEFAGTLRSERLGCPARVRAVPVVSISVLGCLGADNRWFSELSDCKGDTGTPKTVRPPFSLTPCGWSGFRGESSCQVPSESCMRCASMIAGAAAEHEGTIREAPTTLHYRKLLWICAAVTRRDLRNSGYNLLSS